ncbi:MAG: OB-fold nucleic acid binding domain-containing protein, partial [Phycisphaerales bacterium]
MTEPPRLMLTTNIAAVPGVDDRHADAFRHLGIRCVADLILHLPMRYEHELAEQTIAGMTKQARAVGGGNLTLSVCGEVVRVRSVPGRGRRRVEATVQDDTGAVRVIWFNMPWLADKLRPGLTVRVTGRATQHRDLLQMVNPRWEVVDPATPGKRPERYRPVYPASDDLPSWQIERAVGEVLDGVLADLDDHLHEQYRQSRAIPGLAEAYRMMHRPADADEPPQARRRLALDELLLLQLGVMLKRRHRR